MLWLKKLEIENVSALECQIDDLGKRLDILHEQKQVHPAATCASSIKDIIYI